MAILCDRLGIGSLGTIKLGALQQHFAQPAGFGAVRIISGFALGVMLAVNGRPLAGHHTGIEPKPETEEVRDARVQLQRTMRLTAVQVDRDRCDGDVGRDQRVGKDLPAAQIKQA